MILENRLKHQASHILALELNQKGQTTAIHNLEKNRKVQDANFQGLETSRKDQDINIQTLVNKHQFQADSIRKEILNQFQSFRMDCLKSQKAITDNQERGLNEKLDFYQTIFFEAQEREWKEKLASYESNILQRFKQMILAELLSVETESANESGGRHIVRFSHLHESDSY